MYFLSPVAALSRARTGGAITGHHTTTSLHDPAWAYLTSHLRWIWYEQSSPGLFSVGRVRGMSGRETGHLHVWAFPRASILYFQPTSQLVENTSRDALWSKQP